MKKFVQMSIDLTRVLVKKPPPRGLCRSRCPWMSWGWPSTTSPTGLTGSSPSQPRGSHSFYVLLPAGKFYFPMKSFCLMDSGLWLDSLPPGLCHIHTISLDSLILTLLSGSFIFTLSHWTRSSLLFLVGTLFT